MVEIHQKDKQAVFYWHWTGTHSGPGGAGTRINLIGFEEWTFDGDGLILESRGHYDHAEYERQLNAEIEGT